MAVPRQTLVGYALLLVGIASTELHADQHRRGLKYQSDLPKGAITRLGTLRFRCLGRITCLAFSPDGKHIAAGGGPWLTGQAIDLWRCDTGKLVQRFEGHLNHFLDLRFTPDRKSLVAGGGDGVFYWHVVSGRLVNRVATNSTVSALAISPDGGICAAGTMGGDILLLANDGKKLIHFLKAPTEIESLVFSPDGRWLVSSGSTWEDEKMTVRFWDVATGKELWKLRGQSSEFWWANTVSFSPDGALFALGTEHGQIEIWNPRKRTKLRVLSGHNRGKRARVLGFINGTLLSQGHGKEMRIWDPTTGNLKQELPATFSWDATLSPDGNTIAYGDHYTVKFWDIKAKKAIHRLPGHHEGVDSVAFSSDGKVLVSCATDHTIRLWNLQSQKELRRWHTGKKNQAWEVEFFSDKKTIASADWQEVRLWNASTGRLKAKLSDKKSWALTKIRVSPDQKTLVAVNSKRVLVWSIEKERLLRATKDRENGIQRAAIAQEGSLVAIYHEKPQHRVTIWDTATGRSKGTFFPTEVSTMAISPDGKYLAIALSYRGLVEIWDTAQMTLHRRLRICGHTVLAFSRTGRYLAIAGPGHDIRIWDVKTGKAVGHFTTPRGRIECLAFAPNSDILASGADDSTIILWDLDKKTVTPPVSTKKLLKRLLTAYKSYGLPLPAENAKPVLIKRADGYDVGFSRKATNGKSTLVLLRDPLGEDYEVKVKKGVIDITASNAHMIPRWSQDLVFAIKCQACGHDT